MNAVNISFNDDEDVITSVRSDSSDFIHTTAWNSNLGWWCTCEDYYYRKRFCKHMKQAKDYVTEKGLIVNEVVFKGFKEF